jgi:2-phosphoglycerate kinase
MARKSKKITYEYSASGVKQSILRNARSLGMPEGWAKQIADRVSKQTDAWIADKEIVTEDDLRREVIKELEELSPDLAYAYQNHDKII